MPAVSRFAAQKGFDLIQQVADRLAMEDLILIVLGSGQREYEDDTELMRAAEAELSRLTGQSYGPSSASAA